ncbi:uncharacterized protein [Nicotiana sylvestris]|uniref:uncharacterized protein n=1 Tax=Nicotiana sylvestris TaxID=4096 RepID=UPI00388CAD9D
MNQSIAKNAADGSFMDKTFARITQILNKMAKHNQAWHSEDITSEIAYGSPSLANMIKENQERDQVIAGLPTIVNVLTKKITERQTKKVNEVEDVQPPSNEDYEEANYVNNSQGGYQRQQYHCDTIVNPKGRGSGPTSHIMAITTRSGKILQGESEQMVEVEESEQAVEEHIEEKIVVEDKEIPEELKVQEVKWEEVEEKVKEEPKTLPPIPRRPPPFSQRLARKVDDIKLDKFYDILKQLSVNILFVEAFQEMPGFAKYLKDLITKKRTAKNEVVNVTHWISSIIATTTVQNKEDPGAFTIPCTIGARDFARALCDNGDSINLIPLAIYKKAGLGMPRLTSMRLQMTDRSIKRPVGIVDDVLVKVGVFHLPTGFVIIDCAVDKEIPII